MSRADTATLSNWQLFIVKYKTLDEDRVPCVKINEDNKFYVELFSRYWRSIYNLRTMGLKNEQ